MAATILVGICIAGYAGFVIYKKCRDIKNGKFCSCCEGCVSHCGKEKRENIEEK